MTEIIDDTETFTVILTGESTDDGVETEPPETESIIDQLSDMLKVKPSHIIIGIIAVVLIYYFSQS